MPEKLRALVTGASEGLGRSIALELASRGVDLILVSLPDSGLSALASYIHRNLHVEVDIYETDLSDFENYHQLFKSFSDKPIDILVNNAGLGNWSFFHDQTTSFYKKQIELNVMAPVMLTRLFLDQLSKEKRSYILNVGSLGGLFIVPKKQIYGATKSFISYFTRCLQLEYLGANVSISLLKPGGINTKPELLALHGTLKGVAKATIMEPEVVARKAIDGMLKGKKIIIPGKLNRIMVMLNAIMPSFLKEIIIRKRVRSQ